MLRLRAYEPGVVSELVRVVIGWKNKLWSRRPHEVNEILIKVIINSNRRSPIRDIVEKLGVSHTCIFKKLKILGYVKKLDL